MSTLKTLCNHHSQRTKCHNSAGYVRISSTAAPTSVNIMQIPSFEPGRSGLPLNPARPMTIV